MITSTAPTKIIFGSQYQYQIHAQDAEYDTLSYSLTTFPTGMTIGSSMGLVSWTPAADSSRRGP